MTTLPNGKSLAPESLFLASGMPSFPYGPFIGATLVSAFAVGWVLAGVRSLAGRWPVTLSLLAAAISAVVVWRDYRLLREGIHVPTRFNGAAYGAAVTFESIAIPLAAALLKRNDKASYILPAVAQIVGVHFFGLVWAFDSPACWWIGGAMCLLPIVTVTCLPELTRGRTGGSKIHLWNVVVGIGCAVILWVAVVALF